MAASGPAAGPLLSVSPKRLPPGPDPAQVRLRWSTGGERVGSVFVTVDGGDEELVASGTDGDEKLDWIEEGSYEFRLYLPGREAAVRTARVHREEEPDEHAAGDAPVEEGNWRDAVRLVNFHSLSGDFEVADALLGEARSRFADDDSAAAWLAYAQAKLDERAGRLQEARRSIAEALEHPLPPATRSTLRLQLAGLLAAAEDRDALRTVLADLFADPSAELPDVLAARRLATRSGLEDVEAADSSLPEIPRVAATPVATLEGNVVELASGVRREAPPAGVFVLRDATVVRVNRGLFLFDSDGCLVENCSHDGSPAQLAEAARLGATKAIRSAEPAALIQDFFIGNNFCHWLLDWLPRIAIARLADVPFERIVGFTLATRFQREALSACGFGEETFVATKDNRVLRFDTLVVSENSFRSFRHPAQCGHPVLVDWIRGVGRLAARRSSSARRLAAELSSSPRLYLARSGVGVKRALTNEDELTELLERHGFVVFDPGAHSFAEQSGALGVAEAVVGVHGAALTNTVFSPPGCHVLELRSPSAGTLAYEIVAAAVGHDYEAVVCEPRSGSEAFPLNDSPLTVDLDQVEDWLQSRFGSPRRGRRP
jgi:capsular polysaccharide biosynthesis protein